jgi:phosphoserine phosphatase
MIETILIHFSGQDRPGLTTALTAILAKYDACVLDIGQAVVHETLSLGLLVEIPRGDSFRGLQDTLMAKSRELRLQVVFTPIAKADLDDWISSQGKDQFIVTILGRAITADHLARVSAIVAEHGLNVDRIERLSGRLSLASLR